MKIATIALVVSFALSSSLAIAQTAGSKPAKRTTHTLNAKNRLQPNNGNPNGNPNGPTSLSGTGSSSYGGSSPGTSGRN